MPTADYEREIRQAAAAGEEEAILATARRAFDDETADEATLAWVAGIVFERGLVAGFDLLQTFVERFPGSLHIIRAYLAEAHARCGRYDDATWHARWHLRLAQDAGVLDDLANTTIQRDGAGRAFLLLTAAYTESGACSYSRRALKAGLRYDVGQPWHDRYRSEIERLDRQMQDSAAAAIDDLWEALFTRGAGAAELHRQALDRGFIRLAERVDLIESQHRFQAGYLVDERELLQVIVATDDAALMLQ